MNGMNIDADLRWEVIGFQKEGFEVEILDAASLALNLFAIIRAIRRRAPQRVVIYNNSTFGRRPLYKLQRDQILNLQCSLCSGTDALLGSRFDCPLQLCGDFRRPLRSSADSFAGLVAQHLQQCMPKMGVEMLCKMRAS